MLLVIARVKLRFVCSTDQRAIKCVYLLRAIGKLNDSDIPPVHLCIDAEITQAACANMHTKCPTKARASLL